MKTRIFALAVAAVLAITIAGCAGDTAEMDVIPYKDLPAEGYFVQDGDVYYPLFEQGLSFSAAPKNENLSGRFIWHIEKDHLIPVLTPDRQLIFRTVKGPLPDRMLFEGFEDHGFTIGVLFDAPEDAPTPGFPTQTRRYCPESSADRRIRTLSNLGAYRVVEINGETFDPAFCDDNGALRGLENGGEYHLNAFEGTAYRELSATADVRYLTSSHLRAVPGSEPPYVLSRRGFAVITVPDSMPDGLYVINGEGAFYLKSE